MPTATLFCLQCTYQTSRELKFHKELKNEERVSTEEYATKQNIDTAYGSVTV